MIRGQTPIRAPRPGLAARLISVLSALAMLVASVPALAQSRGPAMPLIRDTEIEQLLREYTAPVLRAAGLGSQNIRIVIVNDRAFNAFVADGRRIFVNAGALMEARTPNEIIGVLAHEAGHIAGGHLAKMREQIANLSTLAILGMLLGAGAVVAGGGNSNAGQIGVAAASAPQSVVQRALLSYARQQEDQADHAAVKFLAASGQSPKGLRDLFKRLSDEQLYNSRNIDPYLQNHPMPADRVAALEDLVKNSPYWDRKDSPELQARHDMMRAKLVGFLERPDAVLRRYPMSDQSLPARYARAISGYRFGDPRNAIAQIDALIQAEPGNPYFYELKGQALLEGGKPAEAVPPLRRAVSLAPNPALIQIMLGQALIATNDAHHVDEAIAMLKAALVREPESPDAYAQLAMGYGRRGNNAEADLASAQSAALIGDIKTARQIAARAKTQFPIGSPGWVKADDIASTMKPGGASNPNQSAPAPSPATTRPRTFTLGPTPSPFPLQGLNR